MLVRNYTLCLCMYLQNSVARARAEGSSEILNVFKKRFITVWIPFKLSFALAVIMTILN